MTSTALASPRRRGNRSQAWVGAALMSCAVFVVASAFAVGGLLTSAHAGDVGHYQTFAVRLRAGLYPYGSGFYLEYPPFSLPVFVLPQLVSAAHYLFVFKLLMVACGLATIAVVARALVATDMDAREKRLVLVACAFTPLLLGPTYLNRFDPWPALLTTLALLLFALDRPRRASVALALSVAAKTYAAAIVPVAVIWLLRRGRPKQLRGSAAAFAGTCLAVYGPFVVHLGGVANSYYSQLKRHLQIESTGASLLLVADKLDLYTIQWIRGMSVDLVGKTADVVGAATSVMQVTAIAAVAGLYYRTKRRDAQMLFIAAAAAVAAFVAFGKVFSPQYTVWLVPLVPLVGRRLATTCSILVVAILLLTQANNKWGDWGLRHVNWTVGLVVARNVATLVLLFLLVRELQQAPTSSRAGAAGARSTPGPEPLPGK